MILVLTGATGTGKSALAVSLAQKLGAAILNADAFQVYRELNIATAKPSETMRMLAPHYLFDFVPLDSNYSVAEYQKDLRATLAELEQQGVPVIIAGGTGLYLRAGLYDYEFPEEEPVDMSPYESLSQEELYARAKEIDSEGAKAIDPRNRRRVLRLIQYYLATGRKRSEENAKQTHKPLYDCRFYGLTKERDELYPLVETRVEQMFSMGLEEENHRLVEKYGRTPHAFSAIGVREFFPYWDGEKTLEQVKADIKEDTRHYVKKQETWFRHQFQITWIHDEEEILADLSK